MPWMGTYTDAYMAHSLEIEGQVQFRDLLAPVASLLPEIDAYWRSADRKEAPDWDWVIDIPVSSESIRPGGPGASVFGPGMLSIHMTPRLWVVCCPARWRGFLTIPALRETQRRVVESIAACLGSDRVVWAPDHAEALLEAACGGKTLSQVEDWLVEHWGQPQPSLDVIAEEVIAECDHCPPSVWFSGVSRQPRSRRP